MQRCNLWFCLPYPKAEEERPGSGPDEPWGASVIPKAVVLLLMQKYCQTTAQLA